MDRVPRLDQDAAETEAIPTGLELLPRAEHEELGLRPRIPRHVERGGYAFAAGWPMKTHLAPCVLLQSGDHQPGVLLPDDVAKPDESGDLRDEGVDLGNSMHRIDLDGRHGSRSLRDSEAFAERGRDLARIVGFVLQVGEDAAGVRASVVRYRLEGDLAERRDVLRPARVGAPHGLAFLQAADPSTDASELAVHLLRSHSVGEVAHPQDRRFALALTAQLDLDQPLGSENLVAVVRVGHQLDDGVVDIPDREFGVLNDPARSDFQRSAFDGGHRGDRRIAARSRPLWAP